MSRCWGTECGVLNKEFLVKPYCIKPKKLRIGRGYLKSERKRTKKRRRRKSKKKLGKSRPKYRKSRKRTKNTKRNKT